MGNSSNCSVIISILLREWKCFSSFSDKNKSWKTREMKKNLFLDQTIRTRFDALLKFRIEKKVFFCKVFFLDFFFWWHMLMFIWDKNVRPKITQESIYFISSEAFYSMHVMSFSAIKTWRKYPWGYMKYMKSMYEVKRDIKAFLRTQS